MRSSLLVVLNLTWVGLKIKARRLWTWVLIFLSRTKSSMMYVNFPSNYLIWYFMFGKLFVTTTHGRCIQSIRVDRVIRYIRIVLNNSMLVALKLLLLSRNENHMLSGNLLIHSTWKRRITRVDTTIDRCHYMRGQMDGMTENKFSRRDSCGCFLHSVYDVWRHN